MSNNIIQNKYVIKKLSDVIGTRKNIDYIKDWLETYEEVKECLKKNGLLKKSSKGRKKKLVNFSDKEIEFSKRKGNLLITGSHGCGKSTIINLILKENNYEVINLNHFDGRTTIDCELIIKLSNNNLIENDKKMVILIDEYQSVITLNDKTAIFDIIKDNNFNRWMPIIIITNNQHNKKLNETKKYSNEIKMYPPYQNEIVKWIYDICKNEKINIDYNIIPTFIEYCQTDLRKILIQLDELKINYTNNKLINSIVLDEFTEIMKKKDQNYDLYKATDKMLSEYIDIDNCLELFETQKVLMPLMIHENYHEYIREDKYFKILDILSRGDVLENYIHGEQNWDLLEIHGYISCAIPSYYINKYKNNKKNKNLIFAIDLNRTSVKKMNFKNINKTNERINKNNKNIRNKSIEEFIYMIEIMNKNITEINSDNLNNYSK
jgi:replication factor C subunit 1